MMVEEDTTTSDPLSCRSIFCKWCGALVLIGVGDELTCMCCGGSFTFHDVPETLLSVITVASTGAKDLRIVDANKDGSENDERRLTGSISNAFGSTQALVEETCPKCGHGEATFQTMQTRSADEGQTVFYICAKCSHKWKQDN